MPQPKKAEKGLCEVCEEVLIVKSVSFYRQMRSTQTHHNQKWCEGCFAHAKSLKGYYKIRKNF